jgi:hypothetical protein
MSGALWRATETETLVAVGARCSDARASSLRSIDITTSRPRHDTINTKLRQLLYAIAVSSALLSTFQTQSSKARWRTRTSSTSIAKRYNRCVPS